MEEVKIGSESRRGRKRKVDNLQDAAVGVGGKRTVMNTRSSKLVGRYVQKKFKGSGVLLGRIMCCESGVYRIKYEDGRCEDVIAHRVKAIMVDDGDLSGEWSKRKDTLDDFLLNSDVNPIDSSSLSGVINYCTDGKDGVDADSTSESCECAPELEAELDMEVSLAPPPELPHSSENIGIPEEFVPHLLSVYSFLRSFSVRLFLYPFELDDFVGALNCSFANTLLDSVHVALMRFLKRQFEKFPSDGSELASEVLRCLNWSLLDTLTWPIYLVHYLMAIGYKNAGNLKELYRHCLEKEYYNLSAGKKLIILQILCDNALDTDELRAEIDMREASEVRMDVDSICEAARIHTGYSKFSDDRDIEATQIVEKHQTPYSLDNHCMESQASRAIEDGYGDECRLCGMDGVLVCCDGCPSAYHSRCLGLNKMPSGSWHCPECKVNANNPKFLRNSTLSGADVLGVDPYKQVFVASCDHLLVLKTSISSESYPRYYNRHDIPGVLNALHAKPEHVILYSEICKGIMQYWEFSADILPSNKKSEIGLKLVTKEENSLYDVQIPETYDVENNDTCDNVTSEITGSLLINSVQPPALSSNFFDTDTTIDCHADSTRQQCGILKIMISEVPPFSSLTGQPARPCTSIQQNSSYITESVSLRCNDISSANDTSLETQGSIVSQELNRVGNACGILSDWCLYMGSSFSRTGYINLYLHGDFSASAAANLAILTHEENQVSECLSSENHQKVVSASIALQLKAFTSASVKFFWPNVEKELAGVPRERCSWCFSCKDPLASKRGCLLNAAASNASRGAMKVVSGVQPVKNVRDDRLSGIGTYIMFMEERLSGLLVGPFLNDTFRNQWRRQLGQAITCSEIKILLLELEENIRSIAFSGDWMKLVDGSFTESSTSQMATTSTQKCRPGRRRKKQPNMVEAVADGCQKKLPDFTWWRGGIVSKLMFQRGILPSSVILKPARQGGKKRIPSVRYAEGNEIPKTSRQIVWRSAVEISRTLTHLALQVRYLDEHVRWGDLGRPELMPSDGKSSETEASAFRNACICGKKLVEQEVRYCVAFGSRKHLPVRIMKKITEIEQIPENGMERYWFSETFIPLYLIREYEQKVEKNKSLNALSKLQRKQLKASRENIFSSLLWKKGNAARNCCACHQDVFYRNAAKCHACQGLCHQKCATTSTVNRSEEIDFPIICKQCFETQVAAKVVSIKESHTKPLLLQRQVIPKPVLTEGGHPVCSKGSSASSGALEHSPEVKSINRSAVTKKISNLNWGLIWRKANSEDTGFDFRLRNILLKGNTDRSFLKPICHLCAQSYNADLMYIHCETCKHWFHADAVALDESKLFSVVGFKCCRCRKIKTPVCPHAPKINVSVVKTEHQKAKKPKIHAPVYNRNMIQSLSTACELPRKAEVNHVSAANNHLRPPTNEAKQCNEGNSEGIHLLKNANISPVPMKLPVRRHASQFEESFPFEANAIGSKGEETNLATSAEANNAIPGETLPPSRPEQFTSGDCFDLESKEPPESVTKDEKIASSATRNATPEVSQLTNSAETPVHCKFCSKIEPLPDHCCQICGVWIHKTCSPWYESSSHLEDGWRCGSCRDWC